MLKATKLLRDDLKLILDSKVMNNDDDDYSDTDTDIEDMVNVADNVSNDDENQADNVNIENQRQINDLKPNLEEVEKLFVGDSKSSVNCIRCCTHTLQLVVTNAIKEEKLAKTISECRKLAIALRKPNNASKMFIENFRKAKLNVNTRWNSSFDMIDRLLELKPFILNNQVDDNELDSTD